MDFFFSFLAMASPPGGSGGGSGMGSTLIMFGAMFAIMYFMVMRPQQKKMKEHKALLASIKRGDKVVLSGGMHGIVYEVVDEKTVLIEVAKNTVIEFDKGAVTGVDKSV